MIKLYDIVKVRFKDQMGDCVTEEVLCRITELRKGQLYPYRIEYYYDSSTDVLIDEDEIIEIFAKDKNPEYFLWKNML